jgi:hypothetical protein
MIKNIASEKPRYTLHFKLEGQRRQRIPIESIRAAQAHLQGLLDTGEALEGIWTVKRGRAIVAFG